ncbi:protein of unknown function [Taphrina deformans PYCC 5710]|uniref:Xylanolytic transcriptional activator regulatory domain-containing protein n=1 Tax=Taphrina deformans (strain PYCC 5710 / ATCC 11124 / CBS 356.35 / IMI 108563 / JCM 9778 / NBRC 8474) TaxID=1097556 RepID=R4XJZ7_TAPDE|nr:protein of unknown function [Taphrina deformans PYCC 5710]|eukprot:CCG84778.1 protein of unknown function [Taphrina deformans PYCC 5710]
MSTGRRRVHYNHRTITRSHLPELEERIRWLESLIQQHDPSLSIRSVATNTKVTIEQGTKDDGYITDPPPAFQTGHKKKISTVTDINRLTFPEELEPKGNLFLDPSLESGDAYIPPSASNTYGVYSRNHASVEPGDHVNPATSVFVATIQAGTQVTTPVEPLIQAKYPPFAVAKQYVDCYFFHSHTQAPFLHYTSFKQRFFAFYSSQFLDQQPHWLFILNMVLAIGQTTLIRQEALRGERHENDPSYKFFETAMALLERSIDRTSITTIQCLLLLSIYGLQHPQAVSIYRIVAQAMRVCIELSLHRTQNRKLSLTPLDREMRKRIFWSAYSLDRFASISLGRPCSIADECISCELPMDVDDNGIQQDSLVASTPGTTSEMTFSLSIFKLRRISGRIIQMLYCSTQSSADQSALVDRFVMELEAWRLTIPASNGIASDESIVPSIFKSTVWYNLGYWHARLLLYRFLAPRGLPHDLRNCAEAAIQSVRLYATLLDEKRININWSTLALCFTAGVTLLWCVYLAPNSSLEPAISMCDVQDAMQCTERVLAALSDIWPTASRCGEIYRNICENVVIVEQDGAVQGISDNVMDHIHFSNELFDNTPYAHNVEQFLPTSANGDSIEAFEQLGWTLGGFTA